MKVAFTPNGTSIYATSFSKYMDYLRQCGISIADHLAKLPQDDLRAVLQSILDSHLDAKLNEIKLEHPDVASLVARLVAEIDWTLASTASWECSCDVCTRGISRLVICVIYATYEVNQRVFQF
jgi:hypothetical protein